MKTTALNGTGFTRSQRKGILLLSILISLVQVFFLLPDSHSPDIRDPEVDKWLAAETELDSLVSVSRHKKFQIYPFNPNFITDEKGYRLGMTISEIDRLHAFRSKGLYVNSADDFKNVTKVSDSLLGVISPYFKFPDWIRRNKKSSMRNFADANTDRPKYDINQCGKQQLMDVYGIGEALSDRILKQREALGGFVDMKQMGDIWGLSPEVIQKLVQRFEVKQIPAVKKININEASVKELAAFPYFRYALAKSIVTFRSMNGPIRDIADLEKIDTFPVDNVKIISLYLEL